MSDNHPKIRVFQGAGVPAHEAAGELSRRIVELVYEYSERMPAAAAIGAIEIAKHMIVEDLED